jgi:hypothetical protein
MNCDPIMPATDGDDVLTCRIERVWQASLWSRYVQLGAGGDTSVAVGRSLDVLCDLADQACIAGDSECC